MRDPQFWKDYEESRSGEILRERVRMRNTDLVHTEKVGDKSIPRHKAMEDPGRFFPQWFTPDRAPYPTTIPKEKIERMRKRLQEIDSGLDLSWHPIKEVWQVWMRNPRVKTPWCQGWWRLFTVPGEGLDNRILYALYARDAQRFGGAEAAYDKVVSEVRREQEKFEDNLDDETRSWARDWWDYKQIKNIGSGRKFADHHSGD